MIRREVGREGGSSLLSTERVRLAGGASLRSWWQKKCLLPGGIFARGLKKKCLLHGGILIFFSKNSTILNHQNFISIKRKKNRITFLDQEQVNFYCNLFEKGYGHGTHRDITTASRRLSGEGRRS